MKRFVALLLCLLISVLASACGPENAPMRNVTVLQLAVQNGLSTETMAGLRRFVEQVAALSNGELLIETVGSDDVLDSLDGGCGLILATNAEVAHANANFTSYTSPFYFYNYTHLSLTLNSQRFFDIISDSNLSLMGAMPIAAFYDGNSVLLSSGELAFDTVDQFEDADLTIANDPVFSELLRSFGARVRIREEESQRIETFCRGGERVIECRTASLSALTELPDGQLFSICRSFHRARVNWLILSETVRESLTAKEQAVLTEAAAYAVATADGMVLEAERTALEMAEALGGDEVQVIFGEFFDATEQALRASARYGGLWDWEQHVEIQKLAIQNVG